MGAMVLTKDEYVLIKKLRKLDDYQRGVIDGNIEFLCQNPWYEAVKQNKKMFPEKFLVEVKVDQ